MKRLWRALLFVPVLAYAAGETNDWLIVAGKRVGPITPTATRADLTRIFGEKNVREEEILTTDGSQEPATRIFGDQPNDTLAILWQDESPGAHIRRILFCHAMDPLSTCRWHTPEGIAFGTDLKSLEKLNGRKFKLNGFDWGYGGLITSWEGGRLEKLFGACGRLTIRLDPPPGAPSEERSRLLEQVEGDDEFWSSDAAMQALNPVIDFMSISFQNCGK